jgi:hypothetical protein
LTIFIFSLCRVWGRHRGLEVLGAELGQGLKEGGWIQGGPGEKGGVSKSVGIRREHFGEFCGVLWWLLLLKEGGGAGGCSRGGWGWERVLYSSHS